MENDLIPYPDDDRMDEGNADDTLDLVQVKRAHNFDHARLPTAHVNYIDFNKLETDLVNPGLSHRLFYMVKQCENQKAAIAKVFERVHGINSHNIEIYRNFHSYMASTNEQLIPVDEKWVEASEVHIMQRMDKANLDLKRAVEDNIKENIRLASMNLFQIQIDAGRYNESIISFSRSLRDASANPCNAVPMLMSLVKAILLNGEYSRLGQYISQLERGTLESLERAGVGRSGDKSPLKSLSRDIANVAALSGLSRMLAKSYKTAAEKFVSIDHEFFDMPDMICVSDIATWGVLCALATFDRSDLSKKVLNNGNFRKFLEPEGTLVELVRAFDKNSYSTVFDILHNMQPSWSINVFLGTHVNDLLLLVRQRAFVQYCSAFCIIDLNTMAKVFHTPLNNLIAELIELIEDKKLNVRIDPIDKKLYQIRTEPLKRHSSELHGLTADISHRVRAILVRTALAVNVATNRDEEDPRNRRRRAQGSFAEDFEDDEFQFQPDDAEMINQTRQLSFNQVEGGSRMHRDRMTPQKSNSSSNASLRGRLSVGKRIGKFNFGIHSTHKLPAPPTLQNSSGESSASSAGEEDANMEP